MGLTITAKKRGVVLLNLVPSGQRPAVGGEDQSLRPIDAEWWELRAAVAESAQLEWWLASLGAQVEVLAPARLRRRMAKWVGERHALYATKGSGRR